MKRIVAALSMFAALWCAMAAPAFAGCVGLGSCTCSVDAPEITFGDYNPKSVLHVDSVASVDVECTGTLVGLLITYEVEISAGGSGDQMAREMSSGGSALAYNLYTDLLRTIVWGDGSGGSGTVSGGHLFSILVPLTVNYPIYARAFAGQSVASGAYADSLVATVIY